MPNQSTQITDDIVIFAHFYNSFVMFNKYNNSNLRSRCGPGTRNVIEDPQSYFISIRQVSLPVNFRYFATY